MTIASDQTPIDHDRLITQQYDDLTRIVREFTDAWRTRTLPDISTFLPSEPPLLRRLVLVELIKVDLRERLTRAREQLQESPPQLDEYCDRFDEFVEPRTNEPPVDVIYEDYRLRLATPFARSLADYAKRYPASADAIQRIVGESQSIASSAVHIEKAHESIRVGERLDDFELLAELGKGAFAKVFLARQTSMQRMVALKVSAERGNEPQMMAQLDHPHIVRVYDQRRLPDRELKLLYMQYAPGGTLQNVVHQISRVPSNQRSGAQLISSIDAALGRAGQAVNEDASWRRRMASMAWSEVVCRLGVRLSLALDHAHKQGVLHRDVKPANVLLTNDALPKLADFNISFGSTIDGAAPSSYFGGSLSYMSPEQLEACSPWFARKPSDLDPRADLYSLGVMLWELLHGERPFLEQDGARSWNEMVEAMVNQRNRKVIHFPKSSLTTSDKIAQRLEKVLLRVLDPNRDLRHQTGEALARELSLCLHGNSWDLFHDLGGRWRRIARRQPLAAIIPVNLFPHVVAGAYNWWFNYLTFIRGPDAQLERAFELASMGINGMAFPLGVIIGCMVGWPLVIPLVRIAKGLPTTAEQRRQGRLRSLRIGNIIAKVGVCEWLVSGLLLPFCIHLLAGEFPSQGYMHFFVSLSACGLIATAVPYFGTTWLALRVLYPPQLGSDSPEADELRSLGNIPQQAGYYLATAAIIPMLAMLLVLFAAPENRLLAVLLMVAGLVGFVAAWFVYGNIRQDVEALQVALRTTDSTSITASLSESQR